MKYLFDSTGRHIANESRGKLYATGGNSIGHYLESYGFFIDLSGHYLGELHNSNRLLYKKNHDHEQTSFGSHGNTGNAGNYGNPGSRENIDLPEGYQDIAEDKIR